MSKILILGSLPHDAERRALYESMVEVCSEFADEVSSPIDTLEFEGTDRERYCRSFRMIREADLIIGEQTAPYTEQGIEIRGAANLGKPILVVARERRNVSGLARVCPQVEEIITYRDPIDLAPGLRGYLHTNWFLKSERPDRTEY